MIENRSFKSGFVNHAAAVFFAVSAKIQPYDALFTSHLFFLFLNHLFQYILQTEHNYLLAFSEVELIEERYMIQGENKIVDFAYNGRLII